MYIIMVYDIGEKRVSKILKIARKYLNWIQNSVFEGILTKSQFEKLKYEVNNIINEKEDCVIYFILKDFSFVKKETQGIPKIENSNFL
ncbi:MULTISPECIES: CRISPR-associated endonuclease Cas2 [unclassified Thermosipho (in: thermotogales)]|uniref:CRISPR-associated endonuclease Cas2 n=1 Tax=unclassified Thermosipho (in: thermotogales) TaxID=2676525 RepID=UPI0009861CBC|nr:MULTISPECIES: CRISPR-associated endonuclease Cas2 [unclassified Thermosipho (in: thermotogales)]MBT1248350.1 CRISPR-associated protein Cas2 [Thermosipho sp. 1244]OOC47481.1 CRISPR-associated protein Cas2 [Thermosipho sp. 1223]